MEADVTDCEMNSTFTVALTDIFKDIDLDDVDGLDELKDSMKDLTDAAVKTGRRNQKIFMMEPINSMTNIKNFMMESEL